MTRNSSASFLTAVFFSILFAACVAPQKKVIFRPDVEINPHEPTRPFDSWEIIESQAGKGAVNIPEWARLYFNNAVNEIETMDRFSGKYIFIGENGGSNFNALQQWANGFTVEQDLPRLVTQRVENRLVASASLYPDDEYGEYYEFLIRAVSNGEFLNAEKEQTFWLKRKITADGGETDGMTESQSKPDTERDRYEFLVLVSINRETLQKQIQGIMTNIKIKVPPTKEQTAAITKMKNSIFEGF
jgi:hypothetical protein